MNAFKRYWYSLLIAGNLLYVGINGWKLMFSFYPGLFAEIGEIVAICNLLTLATTFFRYVRSEDR